MAVTDVLRPISVRHSGAGTSVPSGTLAAVTSDDSDATYIQFDVSDFNDNWSLRVGPHTPATNFQRHRIRGRIRIRCDAGTCTEDIDVGRGSNDFLEFDTVDVTTTFGEKATAWLFDAGYGLDTVGALSDLNIGGGYIDNASGGATEGRTAECYIDIDCRSRPEYSPEVRDSAGTDQSGGTVTDTNQPTLFIGAVDYDGLPALNWFVNIRTGSAEGPTIYEDFGSGAPPVSVVVSTGLDDGTYWAVFDVRSTIRGADPFDHVEAIQFDVANTVPPPSPPLVSVTPWGGGYLVEWADPGGQAWDNGYVVAEVYRTDCNGRQRIATVPDGINGSYLDLAIPQLDPQPVPGPDCEVSSEPCDITYEVRYWGYISTFVELPDTIPDDLILGWPSTVGTIPSGWSRVTALDGFYPRGASGTGAPSATGGAASHSHTTAGHVHSIAAHSHTIGGSTGTSNSSTTSARFNGASQPQADQPHSHSLPAATGTVGSANSSSTAPGTSTTNNEPATRTVIWIKSDGAQANYPTGILGWATESVSGWTTDSDSSGRYLKGAAAAGNGGANSGSSTHTHTVDAHTHNGFSHDHSIGSTGLSNPSSSQEAGDGSQTPRWLPRHTHPLNGGSNSTGNTNSIAAGATGASTSEPPNRRLRVLRNTGGGAQTRIIGLYTGAVADLDPLLTLCDGNGGTPDMRTYFARDAGADSINSTGGASTHSHTTPLTHGHDIGNHSHSIDVLASTTASFEAPSFGDLGSSPTTTHDHSAGTTDFASPSVAPASPGGTNTVSHIPVYKEAHFVRLDGTISGGPLPVPELRTSDFSSATVPSFTNTDGLDRLASLTVKLAVAADRTHAFPRLVADSTPLNGGLHTVATTLAGEDVTLIIGAEGLPAINALEDLLRSDRLYYSPVGGISGWFAPGGWTVTAPSPNVKVVQVTMVRQPWPATPEPGEFL
jgi:hypothetical protein